MPDLGPGTTGSATEQRLLLTSIIAGGALGVLGVVWGWVSGSHAILFDGVYSSFSLVLSWLSLRASRIVAAGPTTNYPFGREALAPLVIMVQGLALLGTLGYALVSSVMALLQGGSDVEAGSGMAYGALTAAVAFAFWWYIRGYGRRSELVMAEATQWLAGGGLSLGMLLAFGFAFAVQGTGWSAAAAYVDPAVVIVACLLFVKVPLDMVRTTVRELLEGAPSASVQEPVRQIVAAVTAQFGLADPVVRMAKLGSKLYVELDYLVEAGRYDISFSDEVRHALTDALAAGQPYAVWLNVDLSTDASWAD